MTSKIKISIITINFNNLIGLRDTVNSVLNQTYQNYELIIIDGNSTDGSYEYLDGLSENKKISWISEPDDGVYYAMNKGCNKISGDWAVFMNSGDVFYRNNTLEKVSSNNALFDDKIKLVYGHKVTNNQLFEARDPYKVLLTGGMFACHQSMFFRPQIKYDTSYKVFGDFELVARLYSNDPKSFYYINEIICDFEGGGMSSNVSWRTRGEKLYTILKYFGLKGIFFSYFGKLGFWKKLFNFKFVGK